MRPSVPLNDLLLTIEGLLEGCSPEVIAEARRQLGLKYQPQKRLASLGERIVERVPRKSPSAKELSAFFQTQLDATDPAIETIGVLREDIEAAVELLRGVR